MGVMEGGGIVGLEIGGMLELLDQLRDAANSNPTAESLAVPDDVAPLVTGAADDMAGGLRTTSTDLRDNLSLLAAYVDAAVDAYSDLDARMVTGDANA